MQLIKYAKHIPWLIMHNSFDIWQAKSPLNAYIPGRGGGGRGYSQYGPVILLG